MDFKTFFGLTKRLQIEKHDKEIARIDTTIKSRTRPCLLCKTKHYHNNSFCSAKCCKQYNLESKNLRKSGRLFKEYERLQKHFESPCSIGDERKRNSAIVLKP